MFNDSRPRTHVALAVAITLLAVLVSCSGPRTSSGNGSAAFLGPILGRDESSTLTLSRDGGTSVALPNGSDFWLFGDTPRFQYEQGAWRMTNFVYGTSAGIEDYKSGRRLTSPLHEVKIGHKLANDSQASQFLPLPHVYLPDGSGKRCNKANGGITAGTGRWVTGAALMPDQTNVLITYVDVCVLSAAVFHVEGWGFAEYDWKANRLSVEPIDVFPPSKTATPLSTSEIFGSPVFAGNNVTLFSATCCSPGSVYTTTIAANLTSLRNPDSYVPHPVSGLPPTFSLTVVRSSKSPHLTMFQTTGTKGQYMIFTASDASGPWAYRASGTLPRCDTSPTPCTSVAIHPELSTSSELLVSYFLPAYGPGVATRHPHPHRPLDHLVWSSVRV
jgi:hypothetical protein